MLVKTRKGFSLVEFLVVIFIVGALSLGGLYSYGKYVDNSRLTAAQAEIKMINNALLMYQLNQTVLANGKQMKNLGANDFNTALSTLKTANLFSGTLQFDGKYNCKAELYQNSSFKTQPTRFGNIDRYLMQYKGCDFGALIQAE